jgi:hypothetical protein
MIECEPFGDIGNTYSQDIGNTFILEDVCSVSELMRQIVA